jgi:hypothetical protein
MNPALILTLLAQYGPSILPLLQKLFADIEAGRTASTVTAQDFADLQKLASQTSGDIYLRLGITPPPAHA